MAYSGHFTCDDCPDKILRVLEEIADRYEKLDPRPGGQGELGTRGSPGFGSRSPGSDHIIVMTDSRSSDVAHVWVGGDKRVHQESEHPPLSVYSMLLTEVYDIAELREMSLPDPVFRVRHLTVWLARHVEWLTRQENVAEFYDVLRELDRQLRPVTGDPRQKPFAFCPSTVDEGEHSRECGGPLYPPRITSSVIRCDACGRSWECGKPTSDPDRDEWAALGTLLKSA